MKEPQIQTVNHCTVALDSAEIVAALKLPEGAKLLVNGAPAEGLVAEWFQKEVAPTPVPTRPDGYVPPHQRLHVCETCNRTVKGSGPFASHLKFHKANGHVRVGRRRASRRAR